MTIDDDELRKRPTDPAPEMTDRELLESIQECLSGLADDVRCLSASVNLAIGQAQSLGRRVGELESRISSLDIPPQSNGEQA